MTTFNRSRRYRSRPTGADWLMRERRKKMVTTGLWFLAVGVVALSIVLLFPA